jgi:hypothetical protein
MAADVAGAAGDEDWDFAHDAPANPRTRAMPAMEIPPHFMCRNSGLRGIPEYSWPMLKTLSGKFLPAAVLTLCAAACQKPPEDLPVNSTEVGSRISQHVESRMEELGLSTDQANYCFVKLNQDMDANPDVDLSRHEGDRGHLGMIEGYEKTFMDKCLRGLRQN